MAVQGKEAEAGFVEVDFNEPLSTAPEWVMEIEDARGARLRLSYKGTKGLELLDRARGFWENRS